MPVTPATETHLLVEQLKQRNRGGFNDLYDNYASTLYGVICRVVNDAVTAEDVLQETFVKVWKNIEHYSEDKGTFFTWLLNITRYTAIDYLRSRQHKQKLKSRDNPDNEYIREQLGVRRGRLQPELRVDVLAVVDEEREADERHRVDVALRGDAVDGSQCEQTAGVWREVRTGSWAQGDCAATAYREHAAGDAGRCCGMGVCVRGDSCAGVMGAD